MGRAMLHTNFSQFKHYLLRPTSQGLRVGFLTPCNRL